MNNMRSKGAISSLNKMFFVSKEIIYNKILDTSKKVDFCLPMIWPTLELLLYSKMKGVIDFIRNCVVFKIGTKFGEEMPTFCHKSLKN